MRIFAVENAFKIKDISVFMRIFAVENAKNYTNLLSEFKKKY